MWISPTKSLPSGGSGRHKKVGSAYCPPTRPRKISTALRAYALLASSADKGANRMILD